jgi:Restriction endonuclease XhoI
MDQQRFEQAVRAYWEVRTRQRQRQIEAGKSDAGLRSAVTGGAQMDALAELLEETFVDAGFSAETIYRATGVELPGYYRPEKQWDLVVIHEDELAAAIEFKSQVGPSFGNNFNNRAEEAIGSASDIWVAFREGHFGKIRPWLGYFFLLEEHPKSTSPVAVREPLFDVEKVFVGASYKERYELLCRRLVAERLYDAACFVTSSADPSLPIHEPADDLCFANFVAQIRGRAAQLLAVQKDRNK